MTEDSLAQIAMRQLCEYLSKETPSRQLLALEAFEETFPNNPEMTEAIADLRAKLKGMLS